jgi:hypothetical protein
MQRRGWETRKERLNEAAPIAQHGKPEEDPRSGSEKVRTSRKKRHVRKTWTAEEDAVIRQRTFDVFDFKMNEDIAKELSNKLNCSQSGLIDRYYTLRRQAAVDGGEWRKNHVRKRNEASQGNRRNLNTGSRNEYELQFAIKHASTREMRKLAASSGYVGPQSVKMSTDCFGHETLTSVLSMPVLAPGADISY